jgi:hypothetical protein
MTSNNYLSSVLNLNSINELHINNFKTATNSVKNIKNKKIDIRR